ncbi:MAG: hypothetical protein K0R57_2647 [Paenibacillaceae bacterium]|jgi:hypothetical protein|nr:hypothetical protein [Paenibacillaceae bacterium]
MSCCGNHNRNNQQDAPQDGQGADKKKLHHKMMLLCCVLPVVLVAVLFLTQTASGTWSDSLPILLLLVCPLSHMVLMPLMMKKNRNHPHS